MALESEDYKVELVPATPDSLWNRLKKFPGHFLQGFYNTCLLIRYRELREPIRKGQCPMRWIRPFPSFVISPKITASPLLMRAFFKYPKKDPINGPFDEKMAWTLWQPLLQDLFPSETITPNDFFLTADKSYINRYRQPVLQFIGLQNIRRQAKELEEIVEETVQAWGGLEGPINASELSSIFSTNVISKLLLGHPGPAKAYLEIAQAINCLTQCLMKRSFWRRSLNKKEKESYEKALAVMRQAIETAMTIQGKPAFGSLFEALRADKELSELQIKTTLFMMYLGGSESTGSLLGYLLWQLGQHPEYQNEILEEMRDKEGTLYEVANSLVSMDRLFSESIRLFTPVYITARSPGRDLDCVVKDSGGREILRERLLKGEVVLCMPTFAGRDATVFENPDAFKPDRFKTSLKAYSWLPFGEGAHACPGQWLAKAEILTLVTRLVQKFQIQSFPEKEPKQRGNLSLQTVETIRLNLKKRSLV